MAANVKTGLVGTEHLCSCPRDSNLLAAIHGPDAGDGQQLAAGSTASKARS